jgi:hypothetical protein
MPQLGAREQFWGPAVSGCFGLTLEIAWYGFCRGTLHISSETPQRRLSHF